MVASRTWNHVTYHFLCYHSYMCMHETANMDQVLHPAFISLGFALRYYTVGSIGNALCFQLIQFLCSLQVVVLKSWSHFFQLLVKFGVSLFLLSNFFLKFFISILWYKAISATEQSTVMNCEKESTSPLIICTISELSEQNDCRQLKRNIMYLIGMLLCICQNCWKLPF